MNTNRDMLTTAVTTWNSKNPIASIGLRDPETCVLAKWDVAGEPITLPNGKATGYNMLVCSDDGLPVGVPYNPESYTVFNNSEMIGIIELILVELDKIGVKYAIATTGSVQNRNKTFISIKIVENEKFVVDGREFLNFLDVLNSFNKSCNITFVNSSICVCCQNTFKAALDDDNGAFYISIPHRKKAKAIVKDVPKLIEASFTASNDFAKNLKHFSEFPVGLVDAENIFAAFIGKGEDNAVLKTRSANIVERLAYLFVKGMGNKGETALDVFQAATEYYTHESAGETEDTSKQFESSEFGNAADKKSLFFSGLVKATASKETFAGVARIGEKILLAYNSKPKK
jgi:hypothetical protein